MKKSIRDLFQDAELQYSSETQYSSDTQSNSQTQSDSQTQNDSPLQIEKGVLDSCPVEDDLLGDSPLQIEKSVLDSCPIEDDLPGDEEHVSDSYQSDDDNYGPGRLNWRRFGRKRKVAKSEKVSVDPVKTEALEGGQEEEVQSSHPHKINSPKTQAFVDHMKILYSNIYFPLSECKEEEVQPKREVLKSVSPFYISSKILVLN